MDTHPLASSTTLEGVWQTSNRDVDVANTAHAVRASRRSISRLIAPYSESHKY
jgi:hypothetical protein